MSPIMINTFQMSKVTNKRKKRYLFCPTLYCQDEFASTLREFRWHRWLFLQL